METHQIESMIVEGTKKGIAEFLKGIISKVTVYTVLQIFWLLEVYYLMCNSVLNILDGLEMKSGNQSLLSIFPISVKMYNEMILRIINEWNNFILFLALILFISGIIISMTRAIPGISSYNLIYGHCTYGIYASGWLILIYGTYWAFSLSNVIFFIAIPIIAVVCGLLKKVKMKYIDREY